MNKKTAGILTLPLAVIILALPGCVSIQEHWVVPGTQVSAAAVAEEKDDEETARREAEALELARKEEEARLQMEAALKEIEAHENARREEEARLRNEAARREAEARELTRWQEELLREREAEEAARRELEAWELTRREEAARLQRETADGEAEARENARREEEARRLLESMESDRGQAEDSPGETVLTTLPRYYVVRAGDTFNRIAANPHVYNNPSEWFVLYQANSDKLPDPNNPDQLTAGMIIEIPSIAGEFREGTY
jgi:nucleoid-associated protein YgaU